MKRIGMSLLEITIMLGLFATLSAVLLPLTKQMIQQGNSDLLDSGLRMDLLARDLRQNAKGGWFIDDSALVIGDLRIRNDPRENRDTVVSSLSNQQWGLFVNGELYLKAGSMRWERLSDGNVRLELNTPQRAPLVWLLRKRYEISSGAAP